MNFAAAENDGTWRSVQDALPFNEYEFLLEYLTEDDLSALCKQDSGYYSSGSLDLFDTGSTDQSLSLPAPAIPCAASYVQDDLTSTLQQSLTISSDSSTFSNVFPSPFFSLASEAEQQSDSPCQPVFGLAKYTEEPRPHEEMIPQTPYTPRGGRLPRGIKNKIDFTTDNGAGVLLSQLKQESAPKDWLEQQAVPQNSTGQKIQIRLNWPDCGPLFESINVLDFKKNSQPISKFKLLQRIATAVKKMMEKNAREPESSDSRWRIGRGGVRFEHVVLHSLEHVVKASWQPVLYLRGHNLDGY